MDTLSLVNNRITQLSADAFVNLAAMQSLDLSNNRISRLHARTFASNTQLRTLQLNKNPLKDFETRCFHGLIGLRALSLGYVYSAPTDDVPEQRQQRKVRRTTTGLELNLPDDLFRSTTKLSRLVFCNDLGISSRALSSPEVSS